MPDITYDVGRVSFVMKGAWNLATSYEKLDAVSYNGSLYIAKQNVPGGTAITNTTYWQLAAEKGDKGDTGGVDSVNGQQGDVWFPDSRQLISDGYTTDTAPFLMKGNDSDSDRFELAKKLGNTVAVNQLLTKYSGADGTYNGITITKTSTGRQFSGTATANTTGQLDATAIPFKANHIYLIRGITGGSSSTYYMSTSGSSSYGYGASKYNPYLLAPTVSSSEHLRVTVVSGATVDFEAIGQVIDLTLWFGSNDRIPSDLLSHPENWGDYYAGSLDYNAGTLESADGTKLTSIGTDGVTVLAEVDTGSEVLRSAGAVADEKTPDGTIMRRVGVVDLGTLTWAYDGRFYAPLPLAEPTQGKTEVNGACGRYVWGNNYNTAPDKSFFISSTKNLSIWDSAYTDAATFKTAMSGVYLYYELATPTTEQGTAFNPLVATVKGGVLTWTNTKGIPVGHESHLFENLRKRVEDRLPDPPSADGTYRLTCTISGGVKTYSWEA